MWCNKGKPSANDREATNLLLTLRLKYDKQFSDKRTVKATTWRKISDEINEAGFYSGKDGPKKCSKKFMDLTKAYIAFIKHVNKKINLLFILFLLIMADKKPTNLIKWTSWRSNW